jgi:lysophospholipase L1-like esterase
MSIRLLMAGIPLAGIPLVFLTGEIVYAIRRRLPTFGDLDASGTFGDPASPPLRMVALGDSSVTGSGLDHPEPVWVRRVSRHLAELHHVELISLAQGGARTSTVLAHQLPEALRLQPDLVLLSVGANDALRGTPLRRLERELDLLVGKLVEAGAAVALLGIGDLGTIPRLLAPLNTVARLRARWVDALEQRVADRHPRVAKAEAWRASTTQAFRTRSELFAPDLFHASAEGHAEWAAIAIPAVEAALAATS